MIPQLLVNPNPSDPFNVEASRMFTADMELYRNEVNRCIETHSCRKAYEKKFYKDGFDLELEKEEHPYYYSNDESEEKKLKTNPEIKATATFGQSKQKEKNNDETPFLKMESSVGLFLMDRSKTPETHKPLSKGFKKVRSFTSFKKVSESDGNKSPVSSRSNSDILSLKQSHPVDYKLFDLDKKHKDYLFNLGFPTKETGDRFGITEH